MVFSINVASRDLSSVGAFPAESDSPAPSIRRLRVRARQTARGFDERYLSASDLVRSYFHPGLASSDLILPGGCVSLPAEGSEIVTKVLAYSAHFSKNTQHA